MERLRILKGGHKPFAFKLEGFVLSHDFGHALTAKPVHWQLVPSEHVEALSVSSAVASCAGVDLLHREATDFALVVLKPNEWDHRLCCLLRRPK